jgi:hypothetical protein
MKLTISVKCVCCGFEKKYEGKEMPMCDKCFSPMIVQKTTLKDWRREANNE